MFGYEKYQRTGRVVETDTWRPGGGLPHQESAKGQIELLMTDETEGRYIPCCMSAPLPM